MRAAYAAVFFVLAALALPGCLRMASPVASSQPRSDLDSMAYGQAYAGTHAIDATGFITMPPIGTVAAAFTPRARRDHITLTHIDGAGPARMVVPPGTALGPGDTVHVGEHWF